MYFKYGREQKTLIFHVKLMSIEKINTYKDNMNEYPSYSVSAYTNYGWATGEIA